MRPVHRGWPERRERGCALRIGHALDVAVRLRERCRLRRCCANSPTCSACPSPRSHPPVLGASDCQRQTLTKHDFAIPSSGPLCACLRERYDNGGCAARRTKGWGVRFSVSPPPHALHRRTRTSTRQAQRLGIPRAHDAASQNFRALGTCALRVRLLGSRLGSCLETQLALSVGRSIDVLAHLRAHPALPSCIKRTGGEIMLNVRRRTFVHNRTDLARAGIAMCRARTQIGKTQIASAIRLSVATAKICARWGGLIRKTSDRRWCVCAPPRWSARRLRSHAVCADANARARRTAAANSESA